MSDLAERLRERHAELHASLIEGLEQGWVGQLTFIGADELGRIVDRQIEQLIYDGLL